MSDPFEFTDSPICSLVADWQYFWDSIKAEQCMFITVSPNPKILHKVNRLYATGRIRPVKCRYSQMKQSDQWDYCLNVVKKTYLEFCSTRSVLIGTAELNSSGNVHLHFLLYDPLIKDKTSLDIFRRDISFCDVIIRNLKGKHDMMNNIVFVNDSIKQRAEYMDKQSEETRPHFYNYYHYAPQSAIVFGQAIRPIVGAQEQAR